MIARRLSYPFRIADDGRPAAPDSLEAHIREEVIQLLLTSPGERPFLPTFGGGLRRLVFERNDDVSAGLAKATVSQALSHWLGHRIEIQSLEVEARESTLTVDLRYRVKDSGEERQLRFQQQDGG